MDAKQPYSQEKDTVRLIQEVKKKMYDESLINSQVRGKDETFFSFALKGADRLENDASDTASPLHILKTLV